MKGTPKRRALGKGLSSLIPDAPASGPLHAPAEPGRGERVLAAPIDRLRVNPHQPRHGFDEQELESLASSIRSSGILQPLLVRAESDGYYTIVAGERRYRAARRAGFDSVPVVVRDLPDEKLLEFALIENLQRDDLGPIETALAFRTLIRDFRLTQAELASRVGMNRSSVTNFLRLLELPAPVQQLISEGRLDMGHGRALAGVSGADRQSSLAVRAAREEWSVRRMEEEARRATDPRGPSRPSPKRRDPNVVAAERSLSERLEARVIIHQASTGRGRIEVRFSDGDDLQRLYSVLLRAGSSRQTSA
ncbi:MAG: ParB/RepB/Spo0J family partition protein [Acidobacteriota bacterium]|nr:MAG: ParB/RepB/Spo0J family partition protein [Acidobacteriota bacterium]